MRRRHLQSEQQLPAELRKCHTPEALDSSSSETLNYRSYTPAAPELKGVLHKYKLPLCDESAAFAAHVFSFFRSLQTTSLTCFCDNITQHVTYYTSEAYSCAYLRFIFLLLKRGNSLFFSPFLNSGMFNR